VRALWIGFTRSLLTPARTRRTKELRIRDQQVTARETDLLAREAAVLQREKAVLARENAVRAGTEALKEGEARLAAAMIAKSMYREASEQNRENQRPGEAVVLARVASRPSMVPRRPFDERRSR
jgi:uncharacterized protein (DUF3084 family)